MKSRMAKVLVIKRAINHHFWFILAAFQSATALTGRVKRESSKSSLFMVIPVKKDPMCLYAKIITQTLCDI